MLYEAREKRIIAEEPPVPDYVDENVSDKKMFDKHTRRR